jgi:DNA-binding winged helix-turn-helix (wHTH) protein
VLVALVERPGQLIDKNELLDRVWPGLVVEENNLQVQVSALRKILGNTAIATVAGRGYRFALPIGAGAVPHVSPPVEPPVADITDKPSIAVLPRQHEP